MWLITLGGIVCGFDFTSVDPEVEGRGFFIITAEHPCDIM